MTQPNDEFDAAGFQAFCARFSIECTPYVDTFGRINFRLDRAAVEKIAALQKIADRLQEQQP